MSLQKQIRDDMVAAMKSRDQETLSLLRVVAGEFGREMKNSKELPDEDAIRVIRKMSENAKELENNDEVEILKKYLPMMFGENQIKVIVAHILIDNQFSGMGDMGKVMGKIKSLPTSASFDGKLTSGIVKELLSK